MDLKIAERLPRESGRDYAYRVLRDNVLNLNLVPGTAMSEKEIALLLGISRTPVREAFIRLSQEELLEIQPQRGSYVAKIDLEQVAESRFLRETMELAVTKLACETFPDAMLQRLYDCLAAQEGCMKREAYEAFFALDNELHGMIFAGCGKSRIWNMILTMHLNYFRVRALNLYKSCYEMPRQFFQHQQLVEAIAARNVLRGQIIAQLHVNKVVLDAAYLKQTFSSYFK